MRVVDVRFRLCSEGSGIFCDPQFAAIVTDDMLEIFSNEDLQDPDIEFDVEYNGRFSVHVKNKAIGVGDTRAGVEFTVHPVVDIDDKSTTWYSVVCGSCVITKDEWENWLCYQRGNKRAEFRQPDCDTTVVYLTRQDGMFKVGVNVIKPQAGARTIALGVVTQMFECGEEAYRWYDSLISAVSHLYRGVEDEVTVY